MDTAPCLLCDDAPRTRGLLCAGCAEGLPTEGLCPEQVRARLEVPPTRGDSALLLDGFGVAHVVAVHHARGPIATATLGRSGTSDLAVAEATVSLAHALLEHRERSGAWFLVDEASENGTWVGDDRVERRFPLEHGDRISLGRRVALRFLPLDDESLPRAHQALIWQRAQEPLVPTRGDDAQAHEGRVRVIGATEGGAVAAVGDARVPLTELEYELVLVLARRRADDEGVDEAARGFVPSAQLLDALSWQTEAPTNNNLRGLVRKVRRKLGDCQPPVDVIESRKGLGYRLVPTVELA
jgi:hypothetical protein